MRITDSHLRCEAGPHDVTRFYSGTESHESMLRENTSRMGLEVHWVRVLDEIPSSTSDSQQKTKSEGRTEN